MKNIAFIDGQNLHIGSKDAGYKIDFKKFRIYLKDKYQIKEAYYFIGFLNDELNDLYYNLQKSGFILVFKDHSQNMLGKKKGNVDTDIVFEVMRKLLDSSEEFNKVLLVSGDGDYKKLVKYLIEKNRFLKILFPNKKYASSLYKKLGSEYFDYIENFKEKIKYKK